MSTMIDATARDGTERRVGGAGAVGWAGALVAANPPGFSVRKNASGNLECNVDVSVANARVQYTAYGYYSAGGRGLTIDVYNGLTQMPFLGLAVLDALENEARKDLNLKIIHTNVPNLVKPAIMSQLRQRGYEPESSDLHSTRFVKHLWHR